MWNHEVFGSTPLEISYSPKRQVGIDVHEDISGMDQVNSWWYHTGDVKPSELVGETSIFGKSLEMTRHQRRRQVTTKILDTRQVHLWHPRHIPTRHIQKGADLKVVEDVAQELPHLSGTAA